YEVGYAKPPKHTLKPGQSGNSKGRSKGSKNASSILHEALFKKMSVTEGGRARSMTRYEAIITGQIAKALKGDVRAADFLTRLMNQRFPPGEETKEMQIFIQRFTDGKILGEKTLEFDKDDRLKSDGEWRM